MGVERGYLHEERFGRIPPAIDEPRGPRGEPIGVVPPEGDRTAVYVGLVGTHVGLPAVPSRRDVAAPVRLITVQVLAPEPRLVAAALEERGQGAPVEALL